MNGILLLNKPTGISSARVLNPVKRVFPGRRVGHTGTLDPFAGGLMIVLIGTSTRLSRWFLKLDKRYTATVSLGAETDTLDTEGVVVETMPVPPFSAIEAVMSHFSGVISQTPPAFSALKVNGKRAYERARGGENVVLAARDVTIHDISVFPGESPAEITLNVHCGSGTYVRALARDIARAAGTRGYCSSLERTAVGPFGIAAALSVEELTEAPEPENRLLPTTEAAEILNVMPVVPLSGEAARNVSHGKPLETIIPADLLSQSLQDGLTELFLCEENTRREVAVISRIDDRWRYETVFPPVETR